MIIPSEAFKKNLPKLLQLSGLSQAEIGRRLNVKAPAIHRWVSGEVTPGIDTIAEIAEIFGVTLDELLSDGTQALRNMRAHGLKDCILEVNKGMIGSKVTLILSELVKSTQNEFPPVVLEALADPDILEIVILLASLGELQRKGILVQVQGVLRVAVAKDREASEREKKTS